MNSMIQNRAWRLAGGFLAAIVAALLALWLFNITTPPRDINFLLNPNSRRPTPLPAFNPTDTPVPPTSTAVPPTVTPTPLPPTPALYLQDQFASRGNWPLGASYVFSPTLYGLRPKPGQDFLTAPLNKFRDTSYRDLSIVVWASPASRSGPLDYGVFFWHTQTKGQGERFIAFTVGSDGILRLRGYQPSGSANQALKYSSVDLVPPTRSLYVNTDGTRNRIRVDAHPHQVLAFVNDKLLVNLEDNQVDGYRNRPDFDGSVGLIAMATGTSSTQADFGLFELYADVSK